MEPNNTHELIKTIKHLMVDKGIKSSQGVELLDKVAEKLGRSVHRSTIYNALNGCRSGDAAKEVLTAMQQALIDMPDA